MEYKSITFEEALRLWDKAEYSRLDYDVWKDFSKMNLYKYKKSRYKGNYEFRIKTTLI